MMKKQPMDDDKLIGRVIEIDETVLQIILGFPSQSESLPGLLRSARARGASYLNADLFDRVQLRHVPRLPVRPSLP
jgi:hypothetical protein